MNQGRDAEARTDAPFDISRLGERLGEGSRPARSWADAFGERQHIKALGALARDIELTDLPDPFDVDAQHDPAGGWR